MFLTINRDTFEVPSEYKFITFYGDIVLWDTLPVFEGKWVDSMGEVSGLVIGKAIPNKYELDIESTLIKLNRFDGDMNRVLRKNIGIKKFELLPGILDFFDDLNELNESVTVKTINIRGTKVQVSDKWNFITLFPGEGIRVWKAKPRFNGRGFTGGEYRVIGECQPSDWFIETLEEEGLNWEDHWDKHKYNLAEELVYRIKDRFNLAEAMLGIEEFEFWADEILVESSRDRFSRTRH